MFKKISIITGIITILLSICLIVGLVFIIQEVGGDSLGEENDAESTTSGVVSNAEVKDILTMSDEECWKNLTGGLLSSIPDEKSPSNAEKIKEAVEKQKVSITFPTRAWENKDDPNNMKIVTKQRSIEVNKFLEKFWLEFFNDLYNEAPNFVIVSLGGYRIDGINQNQIGFKSGHTYGAAIDINAFGNGNGYDEEKVYSKSEWEALEENHLKYQIIYKDSEVIKVAHKYTLYWGGEWSQARKDKMHLSFICDGMSRKQRIQKFGN